MNRVHWRSHKTVEDSPHRSQASRSQLGVVLEVKVLSDLAPVKVVGVAKDLGAHLDLPRHVPDEAAELASDGDADFVLRELSSHRKAPPAIGQTQLGLPGDIADDLGLTFLTNLETSADLRFEAIVPGGLDQDTSSVFVPAFGDFTLPAIRAAGELRGYQSQVCHQRPRMSKAGQVSHLRNEGDGGDELKALQTHQSFDERIHAPLLALHSQSLGDALHPFACFLEASRYSLKASSWAGCSKRIVERCRSCAWLQDLFPW
jgi:hypothetical protein